MRLILILLAATRKAMIPWLLLISLCVPALACGRQSPTSICKSNLKNLATALEMWSSDHGGRYPKRLDLLVPTYLKEIPQCPVAHQDTYSRNYRSQSRPDTFALCCTGSNHPQFNGPNYPNYPAYTAESGLIDVYGEHHSIATCLAELTRVGQALQRYQHEHGEYPRKLSQLDLDKLPKDPPLYDGQGGLKCPEFAHGYQQFQWTPSGVIQVTRLKPLSPQPPPDTQKVALIYSLSLLLIAWSVARQAGQRLRAQVAPSEKVAIQRVHRKCLAE